MSQRAVCALCCMAWVQSLWATSVCGQPQAAFGSHFKAHVVQTVTTTDGEQHKQQGSLWYAHPHHLRWQVTTGEAERLWVHEGQVIWVDDGAEQVTLASMHQLPQPWRALLQARSVDDALPWRRVHVKSGCAWTAHLKQGAQINLSAYGKDLKLSMRSAQGDTVLLDMHIVSREPIGRAVWQPHWPSSYRCVRVNQQGMPHE